VLPVLGGPAEIIPVEPDQGNACAGKVVQSFLFTPAAFLSNQFDPGLFELIQDKHLKINK